MHVPSTAPAPEALTRRELLRGALAVSAATVLPPLKWSGATPWVLTGSTLRGSNLVDTALRAEHWIARFAQQSERGTAWPWNPADAAGIQSNLYTGTPGVVLFYLELHHATGDNRALAQAQAGAKWLAAMLPENAKLGDGGLYTGMAGIAYTLEMVHRASGEARHREASLRALTLLKQAAQPAGKGVEWSESTDIISGSAGIGLFLLWADAEMGDAESRALAVKAGRRLIERGVPERGGMKWLVSPAIPRNYPNFSHGTAGVSYFLATLHHATGDRAFLDVAAAGARYLDAIAVPTPDDGRMVFHSEPGNEHLYYLSWCHGPAGTARLYRRLAQATADPAYEARVGQLAQAIVDMHVPERSPGFWNNISQCCGNCGVVEFFVDLHRRDGAPHHLEFAERVTADTLRRGSTDNDGTKWTQAENRVQPDVLIAQTGLMQGASGVGIAMLHLDGVAANREPFVVLPDNPF